MTLQETMKQLFSSWQDSLNQFSPKNFKLFFLVTLKATLTTIIHLFKKFWWLYALVSFIGIVDFLGFFEMFFALNSTYYAALRLFIEFIVKYADFYILILAVRPSVGIKDYRYYWQSMPSVILLYAVAVMFVFLPRIFIISPLFLFITFFYFDSDRSLKQLFLSLWRGLKMFIYNFPFCFLSFLFFYCATILVQEGIFFFFGTFAYENLWLILAVRFILLIFVPFIICYFNNFYIKKAHEQFTLYFE